MTKTVIQINTGAVNVFLIRGDGGAILVDAGNPGQADHILAQLAEHTSTSLSAGGVAPHDLRLILITHGHVDHFGSAAELRERTGAPVAIHALDADAVRQGIHQPDSLNPTHWLVGVVMRIPGVGGPTRAPACEPDIAFENEFRLDDYGVAGRVLLTPGHTPGSVSVLLDSGEALVGDLVMGRLMGLLPKPGPPIVAWDLERNRESVRRLAALAPRIIYVGHGGPFENLSDLPG
jgi:glyoxylase-like metal-dependent hydrolase (beta-lactamase superfamily II)